MLVVEDEVLVRSRIRLAVESSALPISVASEAEDGAAGLAELMRCRPHMAVVDINMPTMDGLTFARKAKEYLPDLCIIILTGYRRFDYAAEAINVGVFRYVLKPLNRQHMLTVLNESVDLLDTSGADQSVSPLQSAVSTVRQRHNIRSEGGIAQRLLAERVRSILERRFRECGFSLADAAADACKSPNYVSETFSAAFGATIGEYLTELRLLFAREVLASGETLQLDALAARAGYADPYYFSKRFKQRFGVSPVRYRALDHRFLE